MYLYGALAATLFTTPSDAMDPKMDTTLSRNLADDKQSWGVCIVMGVPPIAGGFIVEIHYVVRFTTLDSPSRIGRLPEVQRWNHLRCTI